MVFTKKIYKHPQYVEWRKKVYLRDKFTCRLCLKTGGYIEAHHILPKGLFPDKIFDENNGITLCAYGRWSCHKRITGSEIEWAPIFKQIIKGDIWDPKDIEALINSKARGSLKLVQNLKNNARIRKPKIRRIRKVKTRR